jgi:dTDP-4-amino-4,6-dideoxygalactose transaminase
MIDWWKINISDKKNQIQLLNSLKRKNISEGVVSKKLEYRISKLLKVKYVSMVNNGSIALLISMIVCGLKENDEVIIPNCGWISPVHAAMFLKLKIKLIDVEKERPLMNLEVLKTAISNKTKAIIPVHLNGMSVDINKIKSIIKRRKIYIIEDSAQALFSKNKKNFLGTQGDVGCFSFSVPKIVTTGQGGFCCTNNKKIYEKIKSIKTHGMRNVFYSTWDSFGFNFKFNDTLSSLALNQIKNYKNTVKKLLALHLIYSKKIYNKKVKFLDVDVKNGEVPIYNQIITNNPKKFINFLKQNKIEARPGYRNLNRAKIYCKSMKVFKNNKLNSKYFENIVVLPSGPDQKINDIKKIANLINKY